MSNCLKALSLIGLSLTLVGAILLWRSSPSGYAAPFYGGGTVLDDLAKANASLRKRQKIAISLMFIGSILQGIGTLYA